MSGFLYLDHNATTPLHPDVIQAMAAANAVFGNPSSLHSAGQDARRLLDRARSQVAGLVKARTDEVFFTSGGTESNNTVLNLEWIRSLWNQREARSSWPLNFDQDDERPHVLVSGIEHQSVLKAAQRLQHWGVHVEEISANSQGIISSLDVQAALRPTTVLMSIMLANNDTGVIQPLPHLVSMLRKMRPDIYIHTDAVQAVGKIPVSLSTLGVDALSLSAHKFNGPKGVGALVVRKGRFHESLLVGGKQEEKYRAGTENVLGLVGLGTAAQIAQQQMDERSGFLEELRDAFQQELLNLYPQLTIYGQGEARVPNTMLIGFPDIQGMTLTLNLDLEDIGVSVGSACSAGDLQPSHVLQAMGYDDQQAMNVIRISLGLGNQKADIPRFLKTLQNLLPRITSKKGI